MPACFSRISGVARHEFRGVVFNAFPHQPGIGLFSAISEKPFRVVAISVEKEGMADDLLLVFAGEGHELIDGIEALGAFLGADLMPLHAILWGHAFEVGGEDVDFLRV
jgi:hypothetical protein